MVFALSCRTPGIHYIPFLQLTWFWSTYQPVMLLMQENNFKAVLESIRDLMNEDTVMPDWLHDIFLGYGDPAQAKYTHMPADQLLQTIDFKVR